MRTRKLGWTDLELTTIGFGTWAAGGSGWRFSWGYQDDRESIRAIVHACEIGINWIDTAAVYGLGHSEEIVGKAIKQLSKRPIIATKCSRVWDSDGTISGSLKKDSIRRELEDSLRRLDIEMIDLYQLHWSVPEEDIEEAWEVMRAFIAEGKIRYAGVSNFSVAQLARIQKLHPVASLQPPYSMLKRDVEHELLGYCGKNDIGVVAYSPMQKGLLTGKFTRERADNLPDDDHRRNDPLFRDPVLSANLKLAARLGEIARRYDRTAAQLAIAWVLRRTEVTAAIVGARRPSQIEETAAAADWVLPDEVIGEIDLLLADG